MKRRDIAGLVALSALTLGALVLSGRPLNPAQEVGAAAGSSPYQWTLAKDNFGSGAAGSKEISTSGAACGFMPNGKIATGARWRRRGRARRSRRV